jgi:hypothetical protein
MGLRLGLWLWLRMVMMVRWRLVSAATAAGWRIRDYSYGAKAEEDSQEEDQLAHKGIFLVKGSRGSNTREFAGNAFERQS